MQFEGIVNVLKPPGMTSSDVVVDIRRIYNEKRVGHTGTLDPAAGGVLPICIGRATRLFDYLVEKRKEYIAEIRFGVSTDTLDSFGVVTEKADCEIYKLARRGEVTEPIEERKRRVTIHELSIIRQLSKNSFLIRIVCSKGTYIRTLCKDIGAALGVPAYMAFLLRTASGSFDIEHSFTIAELRELKEKDSLAGTIIPMDRAVEHIPALRLDEFSARKKRLLINGATVPFDAQIPLSEPYRLYIDGEFIGLGVKNAEGLHTTVWLGKEDNKNG